MMPMTRAHPAPVRMPQPVTMATAPTITRIQPQPVRLIRYV